MTTGNTNSSGDINSSGDKTSNKEVIQLTANTHFPIKLTSSNFAVWRKQIISTLIGLNLDNYVTAAPPPQFLDENHTKPNPDHTLWHRQDQIIISALLGSCSDTVQPIVSSSDTAKQAWDSLNASYASASRSRVISLKSRLAKNPKGTRIITEFIHDMKNIADELALTKHPVDDEDLIVHILSQLGDEYKPIAAAIKVRESPISFLEFFDKLVDFERELQEANLTPVIATVNLTTRQQSHSSNRATHDTKFNRNMPSNSNRNRSQWSFHTQSNGNRGAKQSICCQFCNIPGHTAKECRKLARFLRENNITIASTSSAPMVNTSSARPTALVPQWMFDSGASHHVTSDHGSLHTLSEYGGPDEIVLGDGSSHGGAAHARSERQ